MRLFLALAGCWLCGASHLVSAPENSIRIDSVGEKYAIQSFAFEVNPQNGRAGILLEYDNPQVLLGMEEDSDRGPAPRIRMLPNLRYDPSTRAVVYEDGSKTVTCATAAKHWTLFGRTTTMKATGACKVTARVTEHRWDNGWRTESVRTLDTYLEIKDR
jgi:hypothetical protein